MSDPITIRLPGDVLTTLAEISDASERSRSWVILRALRLYLADEGADILAISRGRKSLQENGGHNADAVIASLEKMVAEKAAKAA
jgi:predicted transcriptional regulator